MSNNASSMNNDDQSLADLEKVAEKAIKEANLENAKTEEAVGEQIAEISPDMKAFFQRADALISVANGQLSEQVHSGKVGASLMYASARFSASVASIGFQSAEDFVNEKDKIIEFYSKQFCQMLSDNLDDYAQNFDKYTKS